eukprot:m.32986 g.32986  ORF g.32986 m.32986 type:complete len:425 (+) comp5589_c0_seq3:160-1434(+)
MARATAMALATAAALVTWLIAPSRIAANVALSLGGFFLALKVIPGMRQLFISAHLSGFDLNKSESDKIPEALGVVAGAIYLVVMFAYIPFRFWGKQDPETEAFPHEQFVEFICALLSICCMIFLGFADDVLNLKWRYKLILPMIASMPLLMVYAINCNATAVKLPGIVANLYGETFLDLGFLFYLYMAMLAVFCTNTVNILAGVNGVEAAQSLVIALCLFINSFVQYLRLDDLASQEHHELSMCLLLPFISVTSALLYYNWYPSSVFVGDTFCYFAGMLFAVCGILAHFSKTVLLFLIPQIINFVLSLPQLFRIVPCPRHRLPKFNADTRQLNMSYATVPKAELGGLGLLVLKVYKLFRLSHVEESATEFRYSNMTILNLLLFWLGPTPEDRLVVRFLVLQTVTCVFAFYLRYGFAAVLYDIVQ